MKINLRKTIKSMKKEQFERRTNDIANNINSVSKSLFTPKNINATVTKGPHAGLSITFLILLRPDGREILTSELASHINSKTLNTIVKEGQYTGYSVAYLLASDPGGLWLLTDNVDSPGYKINAESLNAVIERGPNAGQSVAFFLSHSSGRDLGGCDILSANNYALGSQITEQTLNTVIQQGNHAGQSVAFILSDSMEGRAILASHNYFLASKINAQTLNTLSFQGAQYYGADPSGSSVASNLAAFLDGREIFASHDYSLVSKINSQNLNNLINRRLFDSVFLVSFLANSQAGIEKLSIYKNVQQFQKIPQILDINIPQGPYKGRPLRSLLDNSANNARTLPLYAATLAYNNKQIMGYQRAKIGNIPNELLGLVVNMLDGRTPQYYCLKRQ